MKLTGHRDTVQRGLRLIALFAFGKLCDYRKRGYEVRSTRGFVPFRFIARVNGREFYSYSMQRENIFIPLRIARIAKVLFFLNS